MRRLLLPAFLFSFLIGFAPAEEPVSPAALRAAGEKKVADYVRFLEVADGPDLLQTAITRFQKGGETVDLVAVVHLGDAEYYRGLNDFLEHFDVVLYEMVGGKYEAPGRSTAGAGDPEPVPEIGGVRQLQQMAKSFLDLEFQLDGIDYEAPNFVHADVDWDSYRRLMTAKNQSFSTLFSRAMNLSQTGGIPGVPAGEAGISLMLGNLVTAITTGDGAGIKRTIAPMLSEAESFIAMLEGDDGTVLVTERNKVVMEKLSEVRTQRQGGRYAIFYGAGHMPDLEERLLADGFSKVETGWADAWSIEKPQAPGHLSGSNPDSAPPGITLPDSLLRMLQENPEFMSAVEQLSEVLRQIQEAE